jgi:5-methylcytosine-specific restriction protein B
MLNLNQEIKYAANAFIVARSGDSKPASTALRNLSGCIQEIIVAGGIEDIKAHGSFGMGVVADVPWVACTHKRFGFSASTGYFVVYLFSKDGKNVYLCIGVGAGTAMERPNASRIKEIEEQANILRMRCKKIQEFGFTLGRDIDLASDGWRPRSYKAATAAFKEYRIDSLPENGELESDLLGAVNHFESLVGEEATLPPLNGGIPNSLLVSSVLTKPFLILTGPSGTGKTRGAVELAKLVCEAGCHQLVAVGADWTDNRHVLGYLNPLETEAAEAKRPIYETTAILDLILHANDPANLGLPHVLILDEMNLSHVERYFADFLSAMELEDKADALKLHAAGAAVTRTGKNIPSHINFPTNLFVIGTVNIDETTYMFSPKVLDRANVIEIHAEHDALSDFLRKTSPTVATPRVKDYGISFLDAAHVIQAKEETAHAMVPLLPPTVRDAAVDHLMALFRIMKRGRGEYGFRTGKEVMAYLRTAHFLAGPDEAARTTWVTEKNWQDALDAQILQKILPKLHGSRSRLGPLLGALATYCASGEKAHAMEHFPTDGAVAKRTLQDARGLTAMKFKNSYEKLDRMISVLIEEQFVSFIC